MERLSDRAIEIINNLCTEKLHYESEYLPLIDAANKLAAYENCRLPPGQVATIADTLGVIEISPWKTTTDIALDFIKENPGYEVSYMPEFCAEAARIRVRKDIHIFEHILNFRMLVASQCEMNALLSHILDTAKREIERLERIGGGGDGV